MSDLYVLLLLALPLGAAFLAIQIAETKYDVYDHSPVNRSFCAFIFALAAMLGVLWVLRDLLGTGMGMVLFMSILAAGIAALFAAASQRFLAGRSKFVGMLSGIAITILTSLATSLLFVSVSGANQTSDFARAVVYGGFLFLFPSNIPVLLIGGLSGLLISHFSRRKRPKLDIAKNDTLAH